MLLSAADCFPASAGPRAELPTEPGAAVSFGYAQLRRIPDRGLLDLTGTAYSPETQMLMFAGVPVFRSHQEMAKTLYETMEDHQRWTDKD